MTAASPLRPARVPLLRPRHCVLGGVSVALARHLGWSTAATRWMFFGLAFCAGAGVLFYVWLWATVPVETQGDASSVSVRHALPLRWIALGVLALAAVLQAALGGASRTPMGWLVFTVTVLAAVCVLFAPWAIRTWQELIAERTKRAREEQRAEIAAHLHDSVLQTLALIQNRAGASTEVARIARAQERELREWLYAGAGVADSDLAVDLRDFAAALELDYPVRIDVVTVGTTSERSSGELAAAAREAMLNAARHAGGEVSVYIEAAGSAVDVFVRDRGPGFSLDAVPDDRLGVRESIIGRMRRAGGTATVGVGPGAAGTQVQLHIDVAAKEES